MGGWRSAVSVQPRKLPTLPYNGHDDVKSDNGSSDEAAHARDARVDFRDPKFRTIPYMLP